MVEVLNSDNSIEIIPGAEGFALKGCKDEAILLLHGFTGAPSEMHPLGEFLAQQGYNVCCPRLPGHGTTLEDCEQSTAEQWYQVAEKACQLLLKKYSQVYVAGLSMGGLLAIKLAANYPIKKAMFFAPAIALQDKRVWLYPVLKYFIKYLPKLKKPLGRMSKYNITYKKMPTKPLGSLFKLQEECRKKLMQKIKVPVLIMQSKIEKTVDPLGAQKLYFRVSTPEANKRLVWLEDCGHIITLDKEYETVFREAGAFLEKKHE